jgi:hypothetical protein
MRWIVGIQPAALDPVLNGFGTEVDSRAAHQQRLNAGDTQAHTPPRHRLVTGPCHGTVK